MKNERVPNATLISSDLRLSVADNQGLTMRKFTYHDLQG